MSGSLSKVDPSQYPQDVVKTVPKLEAKASSEASSTVSKTKIVAGVVFALILATSFALMFLTPYLGLPMGLLYLGIGLQVPSALIIIYLIANGIFEINIFDRVSNIFSSDPLGFSNRGNTCWAATFVQVALNAPTLLDVLKNLSSVENDETRKTDIIKRLYEEPFKREIPNLTIEELLKASSFTDRAKQSFLEKFREKATEVGIDVKACKEDLLKGIKNIQNLTSD